MNPLLIGALILIILIIIIAATRSSTKKSVQDNSIFNKYSEHGKLWVKKMWDMYQAGLTWDKDPILIYELYEKAFGVVLPKNQFGAKYNSYLKDIGISDHYSDNFEDFENYLAGRDTSLEGKLGYFYDDLQRCLDFRFQYQYQPLRGKSSAEVMREFGLNIDSNETLYWNSSKIDWYEEQIVSSNLHYTGFRYRSGGKMSFSTGTFNVIKNNVTGFVLLSRGDLYITNKRIIFISQGTIQNRVIDLKDILEFIIYKDGILLGKATGKKPLIYFPEALHALVQFDLLNQVIRILDRVLSGNQDHDLTPKEYKTLN